MIWSLGDNMQLQESGGLYLERIGSLAAMLADASSTYSESLRTIDVEEWLLLCACHLRRLHDFGVLSLDRHHLTVEAYPHNSKREGAGIGYELAVTAPKRLSLKMICDRLLHSAIVAIQVGDWDSRILFHNFVVITDRTKHAEAISLRIENFANAIKAIVVEERPK